MPNTDGGGRGNCGQSKEDLLINKIINVRFDPSGSQLILAVFLSFTNGCGMHDDFLKGWMVLRVLKWLLMTE